MNKIKGLGQKAIFGVMSLALIGTAALGNLAHAADFDASSTQEVITTAFSNVTPVLKYGVGAILVVGLSIWAIFFVVGKFRKHVK